MPTLNALLGMAAKETKEQKSSRFYEALGKFVCTFANAEVAMYILLFHLLKLTDWKARALIGGQNMGSLVSITRKIGPKCLGEKKLKELNLLLGQLDVITGFRNDLIHRGAEISEKEITSSNFFSAKTFEAAEEITLEATHVTAADIDLQCIISRIYCVCRPKKKPPKDLWKYIFLPWRYKPLARQNVKNKLLADALWQASRPQASPV